MTNTGSKFQAYMIILRTMWQFFYHCLAVVSLSIMGLLTREKVDRYQRHFAKNILNIAKIKWTVHDPYQVTFSPDKHYIVMSNHASLYDIPLMMLTFSKSLRMLAKKELFRVPLWGSALQRCEYVSIDRQNRSRALKDLEAAKEKLKSGILLWVSPEGTRSRTGELQAFKKGGFMMALQMPAIIIPVSIKGAYDVLPPKTTKFSLNKQVDIFIGKPIDASLYTLEQRDELMEKVRKDIESYL